MKCDLVVAGVGGQGILSIAFVLDNAALQNGLSFKQSEVHGMAQRGGSVSTHLRISDQTIYSDLVRRGGAELILGVEPMEALRYREYLSASGTVVTSTTPEENIQNYPPMDEIFLRLLESPRLVMFDADKVAREAGAPRATNMVILGAATPYLPIADESFEQFIAVMFGHKGEKVLEGNLKAFRFGKQNGAFYTAAVAAGGPPTDIVALLARLDSATLDPGAAPAWVAALAAGKDQIFAAFEAEPKRRFPADAAGAKALLA